jgi:hypothetical protein
MVSTEVICLPDKGSIASQSDRLLNSSLVAIPPISFKMLLHSTLLKRCLPVYLLYLELKLQTFCKSVMIGNTTRRKLKDKVKEDV